MLLNKNEIIDLQIDKLSNDGNGIGHYNGMAIFVPFTAVGDHIKAKIVKTAKTYAFGIIDSITTPSADRCTVDCSNFEKCGGCNFRHINYSAELAAKQLFIKDAFLRIGKIDLEPLSILPSPEQNRYRNKVQYPVSLADDGTVFAGFYAGRSHRIIPCNDCMLQPTHLNSILNDTCSLLQSLNISIYNECTNTGLVRHIYLRDGVYSDEVLLCLVINGSNLPFEAEFTDKISTMHPEIKTIVLNINKNNTNVVTGLTCKTIFGNGNISDTLCNVPVSLNPLSFYQINTKGAEQLYAVAKEFAQIEKNDVLLDLYCGMGTIGLSMAENCKKLIGVEIIPEAIEAAKISAQKMKLANCEIDFICADAAKAAKMLADKKLSPNVILLDPPRKGCDEATLENVVKMQPEKIVMISCNPATAARDVKYLSENGYTPTKIQPVDMFPRTKHVECVVLMSRVQK